MSNYDKWKNKKSKNPPKKKKSLHRGTTILSIGQQEKYNEDDLTYMDPSAKEKIKKKVRR
jgi:hypothetical protein